MPKESKDSRAGYLTRRYFSAHHMMADAARSILGSQPNPARNLVIVSMSALAAEALANAVGERLFDEWADFDKLSTWAKYRLICRELKVSCDKGVGIWQQLHGLLSLRNKIVHAKPESLSRWHPGEPPEDSPKFHPWGLISKLEAALTDDKAAWAVKTYDAVLETILRALEDRDQNAVFRDHYDIAYFPEGPLNPDTVS